MALPFQKTWRFLPYGTALAATVLLALLFIFTSYHGLSIHRSIGEVAVPISAHLQGEVDTARQGAMNVNFL